MGARGKPSELYTFLVWICDMDEDVGVLELNDVCVIWTRTQDLVIKNFLKVDERFGENI